MTLRAILEDDIGIDMIKDRDELRCDGRLWKIRLKGSKVWAAAMRGLAAQPEVPDPKRRTQLRRTRL